VQLAVCLERAHEQVVGRLELRVDRLLSLLAGVGDDPTRQLRSALLALRLDRVIGCGVLRQLSEDQLVALLADVVEAEGRRPGRGRVGQLEEYSSAVTVISCPPAGSSAAVVSPSSSPPQPAAISAISPTSPPVKIDLFLNCPSYGRFSDPTPGG